MKKIYITLSLLAGMSLAAQNKDSEKADKLFSRFEYVDAATEYQKLVDAGKSDAYVYRQLADSYYFGRFWFFACAFGYVETACGFGNSFFGLSDNVIPKRVNRYCHIGILQINFRI